MKPLNIRVLLSVLIVLAIAPLNAGAQDLSRLGGDLTSDMPLFAALELPAPNITSHERFLDHIAGHSDFHGSFEFFKKNGQSVLGPLFNHNACGACHVKDGRGALNFRRSPEGSAMLIKVALKGLNADGSPRPIPGIGEQLRDHTINGRTKFNISLRWQKIQGRYPDGAAYNLRKPILKFKVPHYQQEKIAFSLRMTPPTIGMGLLEAVPEAAIQALADPSDTNRDGISGRAQFVPNHESGQFALGRFGFRASHPTVKQQSAAAFFNDMGMTNEIFSDNSGIEPEVDPATMARVVLYQQVAGVTPSRDQEKPIVRRGKQLFQAINCHGCHTLTLRTEASTVPELANQEFHPFTDLLLHNMGQDLSDKRAEFQASGHEWRTTPLWGIGLTEFLISSANGNRPPRVGFLHDGRARTLEEAILWHGGEARRSRNAFKNLDAADRAKVIAFLQSL